MIFESTRYIIPDVYVQVYHTSFKHTYVDQDSGIMLNIWNANSANISIDDYKKDALNNAELVRKFGIEYFISDVTWNKFNITPELEQWYADVAVKALEDADLKRCGVIMEADLKFLSSLEEIVSNIQVRNGFQKIPHRFFANLDEALKWVPKSS